MSRRDPGAATGQVAEPTPPPCGCGHAEGLHALTPAGRRRCSAFPCQCKTYRELITSHVYRPKPPPALKGLPEHGCAYLGCGQPPDAHERHVSGRHNYDRPIPAEQKENA